MKINKNLVIIFAAAIIIIGGMKGLKSVISLAVTLITMFFVLFPLMYKGLSPFLSTVVISAVVTVVTILFVSGNNRKSLSAIIGTIVGVIVAAIAAVMEKKN